MNKLGLNSAAYPSLRLTLSTINGDKRVNCTLIPGLVVSALNEESNLELPPLYVVNEIPIHESEIITNREVSKWDHLKHLRIAEVNTEVELMLGSNVPQAMEPWEVINSRKDYEPYAIRTKLGWVIFGAVESNNSVARVNKISIFNLFRPGFVI